MRLTVEIVCCGLVSQRDSTALKDWLDENSSVSLQTILTRHSNTESVYHAIGGARLFLLALPGAASPSLPLLLLIHEVS